MARPKKKDHEFRNEKGQFMPGNPWKMPSWRPGQSGHLAKYQHPNQVIRVCKSYVEERTEQNKPLTWAGLAVHMGISRHALDNYAKGEVQSAHKEIPSILTYFRTLMESQREEQLTDKDYSTQGVIFALKNHHQWRDEKHLSVESEVKQRLIVEVPESIARRLEDQTKAIEGEIVDSVEDDDS